MNKNKAIEYIKEDLLMKWARLISHKKYGARASEKDIENENIILIDIYSMASVYEIINKMVLDGFDKKILLRKIQEDLREMSL